MKNKGLFSFILILMIIVSVPLFLIKERKVIGSKKSAKIMLVEEQFQKQLEKASDVNFIMLVSVNGDEKEIERNIQACMSQSYKPIKVVYLTKKRGLVTEQIRDCIEDNALGSRYRVIENESFQSFLKSYDQIVQLAHDDDVIIHMRGCDFLANAQVLETINYYYLHKGVWLTYGQALSYEQYNEGCELPYPRKRVAKKRVHQTPWVHAHCKTYLAKTYKNMKKDRFDMGDFFLSINCEEELLRPLAMYASRHLRFIPDVLSVKGRRPTFKKEVSLKRRFSSKVISSRYAS